MRVRRLVLAASILSFISGLVGSGVVAEAPVVASPVSAATLTCLPEAAAPPPPGSVAAAFEAKAVEACWEAQQDICNCRDAADCPDGCACLIALDCSDYAPCTGSCRCDLSAEPTAVPSASFR